MDFRRELARCMGAARLRCADSPDMSGANAAALKQAQLSEDQLKWVQGVYDKEAPAREQARAKANAVSDAQVATMTQQNDISKQANDHYNTTFKPIEDKLAADALAYDSPERRAREAGQAVADVGSQADIAQQGLNNDMAARGVDPSSGSAIMANQRGAVMSAAAKAAAGNTAVNRVDTVGRALTADAANLGRGIASSQGTTAGLALTAGNSAVNNSTAALAAGTSGVPMVQQGYGTAINGLGAASTNLQNIGKIETAAQQTNMSGLGALAGAGMMAYAT